jgi:hypothetical protein
MKPEQATRWVSDARFGNFLSAVNDRHDRAVALYVWNAEISSAMLGTLHHLEVLLRNAIDRQFPSTQLDREISICRAGLIDDGARDYIADLSLVDELISRRPDC